MSSANQSSNPIVYPSPRTRRNPIIDLLLLALRPNAVPAESSTATWIRNHPVASLIGLAYGLTWMGLIPLIRDPSIALRADWAHANNPGVLAYAFLGILGCLWAAVIVAGASGGQAGRTALLRGYLHWRVGIQWYLVALLFPALLFAVAIAVYEALMGAMPVLALPNILPAALVSSYGVWLARYMIGNFEEICWRSSILPRLQPRYNALIASLLVGLAQGFWHLPFAFVRGQYVQAIGLPAMVLQSIAMGIVFTWVYNSTRGSLLLVVLFHAAYDALSQFQGSDVRLLYLNIAVWCVVAIAVAAATATRLGQKANPEMTIALREP